MQQQAQSLFTKDVNTRSSIPFKFGALRWERKIICLALTILRKVRTEYMSEIWKEFVSQMKRAPYKTRNEFMKIDQPPLEVLRTHVPYIVLVT